MVMGSQRSDVGTDMASSKGSARVCESVIPGPWTWHADPEGWTEGPPNVPDRGGVLVGGARPLLL